MTVPIIKIKVTPKPSLKGKMDVRFPAKVEVENFLTVARADGTYTFGVDYSLLTPGPISDPATAYIAIEDQTSGIYRTVTLASLLTSGLDADLQAIAALTGGGVLVRTGANTWSLRAITAGASIGITNGDGVSGNPTIAVTDAELVALAGLTSAADSLPYFTGSGTASLATFTAFARSLVDDADATTARATLGLVIGTNVQAYDADLAALAANSTAGLWAYTGAGTGAARSLTAPAAGLTITNPSGTAGNPTFALANDLSALEGLSSTGIARRTGTDTWSVGTAISNSELAAMAAYTIKGNATGSSAVPTDIDITALTAKASPVSADIVLIQDSAASNAFKKTTVGALATAGSVSSLNGQTGAVVGYYPPQGRLTLATGTPVMTTTQSGKTTIYYTPYVGSVVTLYDGTNMVPTVFSEISVTTTDTAKNPAAIGASKVNDWFVWNDSGTLRLSHGPDWTNDTTRSAGTALVRTNGIWLNSVSITNGPAASRGTYVGTTRSNASSQLDWVLGGSASGGSAASLNVWNTYNRVSVGTDVVDSGLNYNYSSGTVRQARGSAGNQINFVVGLQEDAVWAAYTQRMNIAAVAASFGTIGIGFDTTTAFSFQRALFLNPTAAVYVVVGSQGKQFSPAIGYHFLSANEGADGTNNVSFDNDSLAVLSALLRL